MSNLNIHFVTLTEHWSNVENIEVYQLENYKMAPYHCPSAERVHGCVVLYYVVFFLNQLCFECTASEFKLLNDHCYVVCYI